MASPEKALTDWVFKTCKDLSQEELKVELLESKRMSLEIPLDKHLLSAIAEKYRSRVVKLLNKSFRSLMSFDLSIKKMLES